MRITSNSADISNKLTIRSADTRRRAIAVVRKHSLLLLAGVKANANLPKEGPPGPRNITGDYNRSWNVRFSGNGAFTRGTVGTNKVQARRLEHGFTGTDSLGRHYAQPPYPHLLPAVQERRDEYLGDLREELKKK